MDYHALAQTPLFTCALVLCAAVGAYVMTVLVRAVLSRASHAAVSYGVIEDELPTIASAKHFQEQLNTLLERVSRVERLSTYLSAPFQDVSWNTLQNTCDILRSHRHELVRLINTCDFHDGLKLARFLSGETVAPPNLKTPLDAHHAELMIHWHIKTTRLLQRMVAKLEDAARHHDRSGQKPLSQDFFNTLAKIREGVIEDENRYK